MARLHYSLCEQTNSLNDDFKGAISFRARYSQLSRLVAGMCNKLYFRANDPTTRNYIKEDFGKTTREYMLLSPGGCMSERREGYIIEDADFNRLGLGQCYVKNADGITYLFQID